MKRKLVFGLILFLATNVFAQEEFTKKVSGLWFQGKYQEVQEISDERLAKSPNDIVGLLLRMECDIVFVDLDDLSLVMDRVADYGGQINTPQFKKIFPKVEYQINLLRPVIASYTPEMIEEDKAKSKIAGKNLSFGFALKAAEEDGLIEQKN